MISVNRFQPMTLLKHIQSLLRHFPYTEMLALFIPIYAYAYKQQVIDSPKSIILLIPFIFAYAAGFTYNDIVDTKDDPLVKNNPLVRDEVNRSLAWRVLGTCMAISAISFYLLFTGIAARITYLVYIFLCLAYSGLGIRFKESKSGPLIAAFIIWIGGPLIVVLEFKLLGLVMICLLLGSWMIYISRETLHTIDDYNNDLKSGYLTFSVLIGTETARIVKNITFYIGTLCLCAGLCSHLIADSAKMPLILLWIILFLAFLVQFFASLYKNDKQERAAFWLVRLFFIAYSSFFLYVNQFQTAIILWVFVTNKRS